MKRERFGFGIIALFVVFSVGDVTAFASEKTHRFCIKSTRGTGSFVRATRKPKKLKKGGVLCTGAAVFELTDLNGGKLKNKDLVTIKTHKGMYLRAHKDGKLTGDARQAKKWEKFTLIKLKNGHVRFKSAGKRYIGSGHIKALLHAKYKKADTLQTFKLVRAPKKNANLMSCLRQLPKAYHPLKLVALLGDSKGNPGQFAKEFNKIYLKPAAKSLRQWTKDEPLNDLSARHVFGVIWRESVGQKLTEAVDRKLKALGNQKGLEPLAVQKYVYSPLSKKLKKPMTDAMQRTRKNDFDVEFFGDQNFAK